MRNLRLFLRRNSSNSSKVESESSDIYRCCIDDCVEVFKAKVTLEKHLMKVHEVPITPTTCILCCLEFSSPQSLKSHLRQHLPFTCNLCSASFKTKENFENHARNHDATEVRLHQCFECPASFKRAEHLRTHVTYKHNCDQPRDF